MSAGSVRAMAHGSRITIAAKVHPSVCLYAPVTDEDRADRALEIGEV